MKNLFLVGTPYNLFNTINLIQTNYVNSVNDIFIFNFSNLDQYINRLETLSGVSNIYYINCNNRYSRKNKNKFVGHLLLSYDLFFSNSLKKELPNIKYDQLFIPSDNLAYRIIYDEYLKKNNQVRLSFYEDGLFTYYNVFRDRNKLGEILFKLKFSYNFIDNIDEIFIYKTQLIRNYNKNIHLKPILSMTNNESINYIFKIDPSLKEITDINNAGLIFFDQNLHKLRSNNIFMNDVMNLFTGIDKLGELLVKMHPLNKDKDTKNNVNYMYSSLPFEVIINNIENIDNKILVSVYSTACLTPKIVYDKEPYVILLFALFKESLPKINYEFFTNVKSLYRDKDKVCIPKSIEELENFLKQIN
ncbi:hypothetical protein ACVBAX_08975 [Robertmurraya sp. GLU-23]